MRVGLTGGVASGKSTVSAILVDLGAVLIDADLLAREVVARGTPGLDAVVAEFGAELLTRGGDLDRAAMGALVFADAHARKRLEAIVHPLVFERIVELESQVPRTPWSSTTSRCWPRAAAPTRSTRCWSSMPPGRCRSTG